MKMLIALTFLFSSYAYGYDYSFHHDGNRYNCYAGRRCVVADNSPVLYNIVIGYPFGFIGWIVYNTFAVPITGAAALVGEVDPNLNNTWLRDSFEWSNDWFIPECITCPPQR